MLKILHLTTHINIGGITVYIMRLIPQLRKMGIETFIASSGGECDSKFSQLGATQFKISIKTKSEMRPKLVVAIFQVIRIVTENKIQVIHAHTRVTQVVAYWVSRFTGVPVVTTCHGFYKNRLGRRLLPAWGNRTIAISEIVEEQLRNVFKLPSKQIRLVYNGVDYESMDQSAKNHSRRDVRTSLGYEDCHFVVGIVARIVEDKGHEFLIRSVHDVSKSYPNVRLLVVGEGRDKLKCQLLAKKLGIENLVQLAGNFHDVTIPLLAIDVFVLPATWREGFGLSIVEAMAMRRPVIASDIWALNTVIQDTKTGFLVPPKEVKPITDLIIRLIEDPKLCSDLGVQARCVVEKIFSIQRMASQIANVYHELAKEDE